MLERSEFDEVIDIVIQHRPERLLLLQWLPRTVVSRLREAPSYRDQVTMDLLFLNEHPRLRDVAESPLVTWLTNAARALEVFPKSERILAIRDRIRPLLEDAPAAAPPPATNTSPPTLAELADALGRAWGLPTFPAEKTHRRGWSHIRARIDDSGGAVNFAMGGGDEKCLLQTALDGPLRAPRTGEAGAYGFFKVRLRPADRKARVEFHTLIVDYGAGKGAPETRAARFELAQRLARATMPTGWELGANDGQGALDKKSGMVWCFEDWERFETLDALAAHTRAVVEPARDALIAAIERG